MEKTTDKIQHFSVVTPLSRKNVYQIMQITAFKAILAQRMSKQWCEYYVRSKIPNFVDSRT